MIIRSFTKSQLYKHFITSNHIRLLSTVLPPAIPDLHSLLAEPDKTRKNLEDRNWSPQQDHDQLGEDVVSTLIRLREEEQRLKTELEQLRRRRNNISSSSASSSKRVDDDEQQDPRSLKQRISTLTKEHSSTQQHLTKLALSLPNFSHPSVPIGAEDQAIIVKQPPPQQLLDKDEARDHLHLLVRPSTKTQNKEWLNPPLSTLISSPRFPLLLNNAALLELAIVQYALSLVVGKGFQPVLVSDVVRTDVAERCGFSPREGGGSQIYFLSTADGEGSEGEEGEGEKLCLAGTAEIPLVSLSMGQTYSSTQLPILRVGFSHSFRAEAGARGRESRGLYRLHQFSKVEMVVVCEREESGAWLERLKDLQVEVLEGLGLPIRVLDMPTSELGASAARKYDIEAWMPGRGDWGELSSASNCTDYQSRRLGIRYRPSSPSTTTTTTTLPSSPSPSPSLKPPTTQKPLFAHTLNATAAAVPRIILALVENGAVLGEGGELVKVRLPRVLKRFWIGAEGDVEGVEWV
ncbi:seryl-tRNA synthetase [Meredithblackwellia eburnea MCA 4105]